MTRTMLTLWAIPEVTAWHEPTYGLSDTALSHARPVETAPSTPPVTDPDPPVERRKVLSKEEERETIRRTAMNVFKVAPKHNGAYRPPPTD